MTACEAGAMARRSGVGSLIVTHLLPGADPLAAAEEASAAYGAEATVASSGLVREI